ncbi:MAG: hypothetical protein ABIP63_02490 [Thermoanaerobaculia bacterium]
MVDHTNPTSQFHPYEPPSAIPVSERPPSGVSSMLANVGIDSERISDTLKTYDWNDSLATFRAYARVNPGKVLGGLAAVVIGIGLLRRRSN